MPVVAHRALNDGLSLRSLKGKGIHIRCEEGFLYRVYGDCVYVFSPKDEKWPFQRNLVTMIKLGERINRKTAL